MPLELTPADEQKVDAWVCAIRSLARTHHVAHRSDVGHAIKAARKRAGVVSLTEAVKASLLTARAAGIPEEELESVRALIFG